MADAENRLIETNDNTFDWHETFARYEAVEALPPDDWTDDSVDLAGDLAGRLLSTPAPDAKALRWKLDYFLAQKSGSESYASGYVAQTVADYRSFLTPEDEPASDLASQTFAGMDVQFEYSNEDWALAHLPWVRLATVILRDCHEELTNRFRDELVPTGSVPDMLESLTHTKEHFEGLAGVIESALLRSFIALERLGYSPDCPPPDATVQ